jgi:hypothetical protein
MRYIGIILLFWLNIHQAGDDLYVCKNARITLFSSALIEDIKAVSPSGVSVYNPGTGELDFSVPITTFQFDKSFMQQHFNSDYMESDKFPKAIFKGQIQEHIDITKEGTYPVSAAGELTVHGVTQKRTVRGSLMVKDGSITMSSEFMVNCADHHIDIPQILFYHIAESIKITVSATYNPYKSNASK